MVGSTCFERGLRLKEALDDDSLAMKYCIAENKRIEWGNSLVKPTLITTRVTGITPSFTSFVIVRMLRLTGHHDESAEKHYGR